MHRMRFPVVKLDKALYGHKNSGVYWNKHCDAICQGMGFEPLGDKWPSVYFNEDKDLLSIIETKVYTESVFVAFV